MRTIEKTKVGTTEQEQVIQLLDHDEALAGQLVPSRQEPSIIILPPSAIRPLPPQPQYTYIDLIRSVAALAMLAIIGALAWEVITVIIPEVCAGIAEGLKQGFKVVGHLAVLALAGLFGIVFLLIVISVLRSIEWSESEKPTKCNASKVVINNIHINNQL